MINTSINNYLQNDSIGKTGYSKSNLNSSIKENEEAKTNNSIFVDVSEESREKLKIENLKNQLQDIFGVKKDLTPTELKKEEEIKLEIEKINSKAEFPYSDEDLESIKKINLEIEKTLNKGYYSFSDDETIFSLTKDINRISNKYGPPKLSENDKEKLEKLNEELRTLQGYKTPDVPELIKAEKIFTKIDIIEAELKLGKLDKNLNSYSAESEKLEKKISDSKDKLNSLDKSNTIYEEEEIRENAKSSIHESLAKIEAIKNSFYNGTLDFKNNNSLVYSNTLNTEPKDNKWLDFLQSSREEQYLEPNVDAKQRENYKLQKLIDRVQTLYS
ncbi:hypothetical protein CRU96_06940 [Malaciobacter halophilus]|nr:hypothetical protein [Malaciobacter halophilus]RYA23608.1 hypothetical protein CRU96_06940 [Malaciobacter halophilus]